ncbi:MAG: glutaminyl-peptide cyclotransferase [Ferruginibacter sp.]
MKYIPVIVLIVLASCNNNPGNPDQDDSIKPDYVGLPVPKNITYTILAQHPHDTSAYTQGLQVYNGKLYEGTGDFETSSLRITDWKTGAVEKKHMMGTDKIFGEGINIFKNKIYQLTWQSHIVYVYAVNNIDKPISTFTWPYEGWGITNNGTDLVISDGSANLYFVNPDDFKVKSTIAVVDNNGPIDSINELEFINGFVYANVYQTNDIIKIDPESGHVVGKMDLANLLQENEKVPRTDVLNGIAYDSTTNTMLITGKRWPKLFEVKLN